MPFNGTGGFDPLPPPTYPAVAGEVIRAAYFNAVIDDLKAGLSQVLVRDGQAPITGNVDLTGHKFTNAANAGAPQEFTTLAQTGAAYLPRAVDAYATSSDGKGRLYFQNNAITYIRGYGASSAVLINNTADATIATFKQDGRMSLAADATASDDVPRYAQVQAMVTTWGELRYFHRSSAPTGFIQARGDQTIGGAASGATRANADTANLYAEFWANADQAIYDSAGVATTRGASAAADFAANKRMQVVEARAEHIRGLDNGRGIDTGRVLGSYQDSQSNDVESFNNALTSGWPGGTSVPQNGTLSGYVETGDEGAPPNLHIAMKLYGRETRGRNLALLACWSLGA